MYASERGSRADFEMSVAHGLSSGKSGQPPIVREPLLAAGGGAWAAPPQTTITAPLGGPLGNLEAHAWFTTAGARRTLPMKPPCSITHTATNAQPRLVADVASSSSVPPPQTASA